MRHVEQTIRNETALRPDDEYVPRRVQNLFEEIEPLGNAPDDFEEMQVIP